MYSPGHPPKLPLGADVGPGPEDDEEVLLPRRPEEARQVEEGREVAAAPAKVEHALLRLVQVPRHVTAIEALSQHSRNLRRNTNDRYAEESE